MQIFDWSKLARNELSLEPPQPLQNQTFVQASPSSNSVVRETSYEDDCVQSPLPALGKRQRHLLSPGAGNAKRTAKSKLTNELNQLMRVALPTIPPREFAEPHLHPFFNNLRTAICNSDSDTFNYTYGRLVATLLFYSIIPKLVLGEWEDATSVDEVEIGDRDTDNKEQKSETKKTALPLEKEYINDVRTVVTWVQSRNGTAVLVMWKRFCKLGCAARKAYN